MKEQIFDDSSKLIVLGALAAAAIWAGIYLDNSANTSENLGNALPIESYNPTRTLTNLIR